ncbi:helix-turn-helix transcriptional regulator [Paractinoplanes globisporus]|uniref:AAA family ATPase n=1 Tax=Paractinoplanes globisporus TaxID=113565 RepID=A0ABW6W7S2_9ACTN|nr:AAA family ATPase [Actinoplanes globisporus]
MVRTPFVGRAAAMERLTAALDAAASGRGTTVLAGGEAGIGKSRVAAELTVLARDRGWLVLTGRCLDLVGAGVPYLPIAEAIRSLRDPSAPSNGPSVSPALSRLVADLTDPVGTLEQRPHEGDAQARLLADVRALLDAVSAETPVLLVLEDLHWADSSTLDLVTFLAHVVSDSRVLVLATYRSDEARPEDPLQRLTTSLLRARAATALDLGPLTDAEMTALLEGISKDPVLTGTIVQRAEGNPFYAEELYAAATRGEPDLPYALREMLLQRAARLDPRSRTVLRTAAAAGRDVSYGLLAAVVPLAERELQDALRSAVDQFLLIPDQDAGTFRFRHSLLAEAVYQTLLPGEREAVHARLAETLCEQPHLAAAGLVASDLAHHWAAAGRPVEALAASVRAARGAEALAGPAEALRHAEMALTLWPRVPDPDDVAGTPLVALLDWAAELAYLTGNNGRAAEIIERAIDLSDVGVDPNRAGSRFERLGTYLLPAGRREQGLAAFRRAVELVSAGPPSAERVRVLAALGNALLLSDSYDESRQACQQALDLAAAIGDRRSAFRAADVLAADLCYLGRLDEGLAMLFAACEPDPERNTSPYQLRPYVHLSDVLVMAGRLPEAIRVAYEGLMTARRLGVERGVGTVLASNLAEALLGTGDWARADDVLTTALRNGGTFWSHYPHIQRAQLAIWRGEFDTAREHLRSGAQAALEPPTAPFHAILHAELAAWEGRIDDAASAVDEALRQAESIGVVSSRPHSCAIGLRVESDRTRLAIAGRDAATVDKARRRAGQLLRDARRSARPAATSRPDAAAWLAMAEAEHAGVEGSPNPHLWQAAVTAWKDLDRPYGVAYCQWQHAAALALAGSTAADTTAAARAAHQLATRLGAEPIRREVELLAQRARLDLVGIRRFERTGAPSPLGLTAREDEVLKLLGRGYTNRQIAAELTISVKTASVHVSHILHKLGMSRRLEAAAIAHRLTTSAD